MDGAVARPVSHLRNRAGAEMSGGASDLAGLRGAKFRTAAILAAFALGLFLFTLYSGLK